MEQYLRTYLYRDVAGRFPRLDTSRFLLFLQLLAGLAGDVVNDSEVARGHMRDSGLLHHLLRIPDLEALLGHPRHGLSWEGMVIEEFNRQLVCTGEPFEAYYYRTSAGAEVDLVLEDDFGLVPIEIKRGSAVDPRNLRGIRDFVAERSCRFGIVVNNDTAPRLYDERLVGVPFVFL